MAEVVWTPRAYADLEAIGDYYAQDAPGYAETLVRKLLGAADHL
jgi:plasmid stabilization system protein ParE